LFDEEAGLDVSNTDDIEEVTNYIAAYKLVRENLRDPKGLPISVRLMCEAPAQWRVGRVGALRAKLFGSPF
jgi:hypothetical protein